MSLSTSVYVCLRMLLLHRPGNQAVPVRRRPAVLAMSGLDFNRAAAPAVELLIGATTENDALDLWRSLLSVKRG